MLIFHLRRVSFPCILLFYNSLTEVTFIGLVRFLYSSFDASFVDCEDKESLFFYFCLKLPMITWMWQFISIIYKNINTFEITRFCFLLFINYWFNVSATGNWYYSTECRNSECRKLIRNRNYFILPFFCCWLKIYIKSTSI